MYYLNLCTVLLQFVYLFVKRKFGGKTPLDLASQKPELLALVKRFTSFSPSLNGHQDVSASVHQLQHSSGVTSGGMTQIKEQKYKSNNIFIYFYWLYKQCLTVTTDAPQFTRCLFTALRTIISELQKSGCNSCSGIFVTTKCLCNNS
jgi:hypothetical protein